MAEFFEPADNGVELKQDRVAMNLPSAAVRCPEESPGKRKPANCIWILPFLINQMADTTGCGPPLNIS
jgi:hypothetical protein